MGDIARTQARVKEILLRHFETADEDEDGDIGYRSGSTVGFVRVRDWTDDSTVVACFAILARNVPGTPQLFEYVARNANGFIMGHLGLVAQQDGLFTVSINHTLLGEYLDEQELMDAFNGVCSTGDQLDDEIVATFGGETFLT